MGPRHYIRLIAMGLGREGIREVDKLWNGCPVDPAACYAGNYRQNAQAEQTSKAAIHSGHWLDQVKKVGIEPAMPCLLVSHSAH